MDRTQKTEEPAVQVVGFHVEGTQVPVPQGSDNVTEAEGAQNSSSVPYLPPALSVRQLAYTACFRIALRRVPDGVPGFVR